MVHAIVRWLEAFTSLAGKLTSTLVALLMLLVVTTVVMSAFEINTVWAFATPLPVVGAAITLNTLLDMQWYLFAYFVMCGLAYTLLEDGHVCVDFVSSALSPKARAALHLLGNLVFLFPFCVLMIKFSYAGTVQSFVTAEGSSYDGLGARWLVKLPLLLGFVLLALAGLADSLRQGMQLLSRERMEPQP